MIQKRAKVQKLSCKWYLADDVRSEVGGKCTLVGVYTDDIVIVPMPIGAPNPTPSRPLAIEGLAILCSLRGLTGSAKFELTIAGTNTSGTVQRQNIDAESPNAAHNLNLIARMAPVIVESFGEKSMTIESKELHFRDEFKFQIVRGLLPVDATLPRAKLSKSPSPSVAEKPKPVRKTPKAKSPK